MQLESQDARRAMMEEQRKANALRKEAAAAASAENEKKREPVTPKPKVADSATTPKPVTPKPAFHADPASPAPCAMSEQKPARRNMMLRRSSGPDAELQALAKEVQHFEDECRISRQWKPDGPTREEDRSEYLASQAEVPLAEILRLGKPVYTTSCFKHRTKHGIFRRSGFHKIFLVVRERFMYFFDTNDQKAKSLGAAYLFGADVDTVQDAVDGKSVLLRVVPSVPRKPSKSEMGATEENNVLLAFDSHILLTELQQVLQHLCTPACPQRVAEYLKRLGAAEGTE